MTEFNPGQFVIVRSLFCGICNEFFEGQHVGVVGDMVPRDEEIQGFGPAPHIYVRELTCPQCKDVDLYGDTGGAIYSHTELELS